MIYIVVLFLKILLYMNLIGVESNKFFVFGLSGLFVVFIYSLIYRDRVKGKEFKAFLVYLVLSLILFVDVIHFAYFKALPSVNMLDQLGQVGDVTASVREIFTLKNLLMLLDLPLILVFLLARRKRGQARSLARRDLKVRSERLLSLGLLLFIVLNLVFLKGTDRLDSVTRQELFSYHYRDIKEALFSEKTGQTAGQDEEKLIAELKEKTRLKKGKYTGQGKGMNLLVVQVESLQNFVIGREYEGQELTPFLNQLIETDGSLYFDNYYQMTGTGNTSDAEFVTNNSLYPSQTGPSYKRYEDRDFYGLPLLLRDEGYSAWAFHGYKRDFWNRDKAYVKQGFERFIAQEDLDVKLSETIGMGISDEFFYEKSLDYLKDLKQPFYGFFISLTNHNPYIMPEHERTIKLSGKYKDSLLGNYFQSVNHTDRQLAHLVELLKEEGLYDNTIIALYGDHVGIVSNEENDRMMEEVLGKPYGLEDEMNIPLIIHIPGMETRETISDLGSQLDFYPTMANIMGLDNDKGLVFGRDLLNSQEPGALALQNYVPKGSFFAGDKVVILPIDGSFEKSRAYDKLTGKEEDLSKLKPVYERLLKEVNLSNYIMNNNLMKDIMEDKSSFELASVQDELSKDIVSLDSSLEDLEGARAKGLKEAKLSFSYDQDKKEAILEDGGLEEVYNWYGDQGDFKILVQDQGKKLEKVCWSIGVFELWKNDQRLAENIYPIVGSFESYERLRHFGFKLVLDLKDIDLDSKDYREFEDKFKPQRFALTGESFDQKKADYVLSRSGQLILRKDMKGLDLRKYKSKKGVSFMD